MAAKRVKKQEKRSTWNKGIEVGQRAAFTPQEVKRIKSVLAKRGDKGYATSQCSRPPSTPCSIRTDLLSLTVKDVRKRDGTMRDTITVPMAGTTSVGRVHAIDGDP